MFQLRDRAYGGSYKVAREHEAYGHMNPSKKKIVPQLNPTKYSDEFGRILKESKKRRDSKNAFFLTKFI
jgi:hypothetical protein